MDKFIAENLKEDIGDILYLLNNIETFGEGSRDDIIKTLIKRRCEKMLKTINDEIISDDTLSDEEISDN